MFDRRILDELEIVAHRGAEKAGAALSAFLRHPATIRVNEVDFMQIETIPLQLGNAESLSVGLVSRVTGEVEGNAVLLFGRDDALRLVRLLGSRAEEVPADGFGPLERSMLEETANITISSFMNSLSAHLARSAVPNAPVYLLDMAGAILSVVLMESAACADRAAVFSTRFACREEGMGVLFVFLPSPASLEALQEGLDGDDEE